MKKISILFIFSVILSLFAGEVNAAGPRLKKHPKHVVLIAFDGLSAVAIRNHPMPNFNRLMEEGAYTLNNRSILPSSSAPNWASMFFRSRTGTSWIYDLGKQDTRDSSFYNQSIRSFSGTLRIDTRYIS